MLEMSANFSDRKLPFHWRRSQLRSYWKSGSGQRMRLVCCTNTGEIKTPGSVDTRVSRPGWKMADTRVWCLGRKWLTPGPVGLDRKWLTPGSVGLGRKWLTPGSVGLGRKWLTPGSGVWVESNKRWGQKVKQSRLVWVDNSYCFCAG